MQIPYRTQSSVEAYIAGREWREARLPACPLHPCGGCSFARHGSYARATPQGLRIARWYCPQGHQTFSLLPDFLAARLPGLLTAIEDTVAAAMSARSMQAAADALRGVEVSLPGALRWLRRRVRAVHEAFDAVARLAAQMSIVTLASCSLLRSDLGPRQVLLGLRRSLSPQFLHELPAPLGFRPLRGFGRLREGHSQHDMGTDGPLAARYCSAADITHAPCNANRSTQRPRPPPKTCSVSGVPTAVSRTAAPVCICSGCGDSVPIARSASSLSGPS